MIQLTKRLVMTADKHCYMVGEPRQRPGRPVGIKEPKYYSTAAQAVRGALSTTMRMAVEDNEVTTLREFIQKQEQMVTELEALIMPLEGGNGGQSVVKAHKATETGSDTPKGYEHEAAALASLSGDAARDLAQERLDASQNAAEIAWLLAQCEGGAL